MPEIAKLTYFPLTGAQGVDADHVLLRPGGVVGDHEYVLYNPANGQRVSEKERHQLLQLQPILAEGCLWLYREGQELLEVPPIREDMAPEVTVHEFDDPTPCYDAGNKAARVLSEFVGDAVRLAVKSQAWLHGGGIPPVFRRNAAMHIAVAESVADLRAQAPAASFDYRRFRAQVLVEGEEPYGELGWVGRTLVSRQSVIDVVREAKRCIVTALEPQTGENLKDVPKLFKYLNEQAGRLTGKAVFGVYGAPRLQSPHQIAALSVGESLAIY